MLSNTAIPKYYKMFRDAVERGEIPVNREISLQMNRIDRRIADPRYYYDPDPVERYILFCESELVLTDGDPMEVLDTFKLWAEDLLCWFYIHEMQVPEPLPNNRGTRYVTRRVLMRLCNKQYLIVARGAAKSLYESSMQAYFLNCDLDTTQQITVSPTMKQADEIMQPIRTAITRARGPVFKLLTMGSAQNTTGNRFERPQLVSTKKGIENLMTNSLLEVRPMSVDKLQGSRAKYWTIDEWLSGDEVREDIVSAAEQGASKNDEYIILAVSSEGVVRNGVGDNIKMELMSILRDEYPAHHVSIWHYKLDDVAEVGIPAMWLKAQPNLGKTVSWEVYQKDVERAENASLARNDILAKRFGLPMEGLTFFFTYEETLPHRKQNFWNQPCSVGVDLSQGDDFCAFTFLFPLPRDRFGVKTRSYISSLTLKKLAPAMRQRYEEFIREGSLVVLECTVLDMDEVFENLDAHIIECNYEPRSMGYDVYNSEVFLRRWSAEYGEWGVEKVRQGAQTESVPLGEIKTLAGERRFLFDELLMTFTMSNSTVIIDTNNNRKLSKMRQDEKIDNVSALMDAYVAWKAHKEAFV